MWFNTVTDIDIFGLDGNNFSRCDLIAEFFEHRDQHNHSPRHHHPGVRRGQVPQSCRLVTEQRIVEHQDVKVGDVDIPIDVMISNSPVVGLRIVAPWVKVEG